VGERVEERGACRREGSRILPERSSKSRGASRGEAPRAAARGPWKVPPEESAARLLGFEPLNGISSVTARQSNRAATWLLQMARFALRGGSGS